MDVTQALKDAENSLRDFIAYILEKKFGSNWIEKSGVTQQRIAAWKERKEVEEKKQALSGAVDERLLYYADFYDLSTILEKHWSEFTVAFGDLKTFKVFLKQLEDLRNPEAHRRELLPHQKHLAIGISGEIRTRIVRYRSKGENIDDYFPKIESARDNLGNVWTWTTTNESLQHLITKMVLKEGDALEFVVTASDPFGGDLEYRLRINPHHFGDWGPENVLSYIIEKKDIRKLFVIRVQVRSQRDYHASIDYDDEVSFSYLVFPPKP